MKTNTTNEFVKLFAGVEKFAIQNFDAHAELTIRRVSVSGSAAWEATAQRADSTIIATAYGPSRLTAVGQLFNAMRSFLGTEVK